MSLFSSKSVDASTASLFAKPVRRDDLLNEAREAHSAAPAAVPEKPLPESESSDEEDAEPELEDKYLLAKRASKKTDKSSEAPVQAEEAVNGSSSEVESEAEAEDDVEAEEAQPEKPGRDDDMERTLFVKNVPYSVITDRKVSRAFRRLFEPGVKSVRFRSIAMSEMMPRKAAFIKQKLHPSRNAVNSYVVFNESDRVYDAMNELNGREFAEHHLFVDHAAHPRKQDSKRSVFVGNLPFEASEEALYAHFADCGAIENIRIVRDPQYNLGKGFAYVQFEDVSTVQVALLKNASKFESRELRVTRCQSKAVKKSNKPPQKPLYQRKAEPKKPRRRERTDESGMVLEGERAKVGKPGIDKKRRRKASKGPGSAKGPRSANGATRPKKARHN